MLAIYQYRWSTRVLPLLTTLLFTCCFSWSALAQQNTRCADPDEPIYSATAFFNYGAGSGLYNRDQTAAVTVGQLSTQLDMYSASYKSEFGFWAQFLLPPLAPNVQASEGSLGDRVEVTWTVNSLSPSVTDVFKIYRNGTFLDEVANDERVYVDYNVVPGEFYTYSVRGVNRAGIGAPGSFVGFLNPNGTITGQVTTVSGNPVANCAVDITPTLGSALSFDGVSRAFADYDKRLDSTEMTVSFWVKQDSLSDDAGLVDLGHDRGVNWWTKTLIVGDGRGVQVGMAGGLAPITYAFPDSVETDWHHVAATYNGSSLLLYIDGQLVGSTTGTMSRFELGSISIGCTIDQIKYFEGLLDDVRIYNRRLTQTEIQRTIYKSVSGDEPGLVAYWKMDEGRGVTTFDLTDNDNRLYLCGAEWSDDRAPITSSALTNEDGYYQIEGIDYGNGQTFTVRPSKKIYSDISLEFNAADEKYAQLTNFNPFTENMDTTTISVSYNVFDLQGTQTILSKSDKFDISQVNGSLVLTIEGQSATLGTVELGWQHDVIELMYTGSSIIMQYRPGGGNVTFTSSYNVANTDWQADGQRWIVGAKGTTPVSQFFTGLVDDVVFYEGFLSTPTLQTINNLGTDPSIPSIYTYFSINEGTGDSLYNFGPAGGAGVVLEATWADLGRRQTATDHEFQPSTKLVTLNSTNTSTDQVDFIDLSTIPVSGYVRYEGTTCFADSVEILLDGASTSPPTFTNSDGYFVMDLEPGASGKLSPKFEGHSFSPAFYQVRSVQSPVAGVLFRNTTKRSVRGRLAGGNCGQSIFNPGETAEVFLQTVGSVCIDKTFSIEQDENGDYVFNDLPPLRFTIGVSDHDDPAIDTFFMTSGRTIDLTFDSDTVDFTYYSRPVITYEDFGENNDCGLTVLKQNKRYTIDVSIQQNYAGGSCPVDTGRVVVFNSFSQDAAIVDTLLVGGSFKYPFYAGPPNIASPFTKSTTMLATADNVSSIPVAIEALITGQRPRQVNFVSTTPEFPLMVLHDPPGDESYSYWEEGTTHCTTLSFDSSRVEGEDKNLFLSFLPDLSISTGGGFVSIENTVDLTLEKETTIRIDTNNINSTSGQVCTETFRRFSTSEDELIVGPDADLFIGAAMNMLFGVTDQLSLVDCTPVLDTSLHVFPDGFATTFAYTKYEIENIVIPNLIATGDFLSVQNWQAHLGRNEIAKSDAVFQKNYSYGSGVSIEEQTRGTRSKSTSVTFETQLDTTTATALGILINGQGINRTLSTTFNVGYDSTFTEQNDTTEIFGYRLSDNDPGDLFTVNILEDPYHESPLFDTRSGQSSCPYEENTVNRDEVTMEVDQQVQVNVPENGTATFQFNLGNISQTAESRNYVFSLRTASNVNGAEVKIAGADPDDTEFFIPPFESVPVTVSVERGPNSFEDTLTFDLFVQCEDDRRIALGQPRTETQFQTSETVFVSFVEPCSFVDINDPVQDWVLTPADGDSLAIRMVDYDINDADLEKMSVQYRRTQGNGVWIQIMEVPKDSLGPTFERVYWNTAGLADGLYEIRAQALCFGNQETGTSHVIKGKIERTPPQLFGTAEPADGVLSLGDEISITFTEPIQCDGIIKAAGIGANIDNNNVGLYREQTGELVDFTLSCSNDKLILAPPGNGINSFIQYENERLRVELDAILDLAGNPSASRSWDFVVDQNELNWLDRENVTVLKLEEDFVVEERRIENRGGFNVSWTLQDIPDYLTVFPSSGDLAPGDVTVITFEFDESMPFGQQLDTIQLAGIGRLEPMIIDARVTCPSPDWSVNPSDYEYGMNFVLQLDIEGDVSEDEEDLVAAYIDDELRGVASVEYYSAIDSHFVFLTVYSNSLDPDLIDFRIWDASTCTVFSPVVEAFTFQSDDLIGSVQAPQVIHTDNLVVTEIPIHGGWNWLSFNLELSEPSPDSLLQDIDNPDNALIKSQTEFAQESPGFGWFGSLDSIGAISAYQLRANERDTILMRGNLIDPDSVVIPIVPGWNWIGYIPRSPLPINEALESLDLLDGDLIKSQTQFAQFVNGLGWIGNLANLRPSDGYILKSSVVDTIMYPNTASFMPDLPAVLSKRASLPEGWAVSPPDYEYSMTMTAEVVQGEDNVVESDWVLGAFAGDECRGIAYAIYVEPLDAYLFFMTSYANVAGEQYSYRLFDGVDELALDERQYFAIDDQIGTVSDPFEFELTTTAVEELAEAGMTTVRLDPNPVQQGADVTITIDLPQSQTLQVKVIDTKGQLIKKQSYQALSGENSLALSTRGLVQGLYHVVVTYDDGVSSQRLVIIQ